MICLFPRQTVTRVYVPRFFVSSQQRFGVTNIKAPSACHSSRGLDRLFIALRSRKDHVIALRQINVTAQCYRPILFRRQQENPSSRREGMLIQRHEEKSAPACGRERELALAPLVICLSLPGPVRCKLGQPGVLFVLPEVLTPVRGPSFVLFSQAFLFLTISHRHSGLLFPILTT